MTKQPSRSSSLIAAMHHAALTALAASPTGQLHKDCIMQAIESNVPLDDWACTVYDNGNTRWRSIFMFASVGLVKGGYVTKLRGVWATTDEGRAVVNAPYDGPAFLAEVIRRYQAWKGSQLAMPEGDTRARTTAYEDGDDSSDDDLEVPEPPEARMAAIQRQANVALSAELLEKIKAEAPTFCALGFSAKVLLQGRRAKAARLRLGCAGGSTSPSIGLPSLSKSVLEEKLREYLPSWQVSVDVNPESIEFTQFSPAPKTRKLTSC